MPSLPEWYLGAGLIRDGRLAEVTSFLTADLTRFQLPAYLDQR